MNRTNPKDLIFAFRILNGMTQVEFAKRCEISQASVSKIESGEKGITVDDFEKVLKAMGLRMKIIKESYENKSE